MINNFAARPYEQQFARVVSVLPYVFPMRLTDVGNLI